jgi:glyoxylase-like metal-dependent hydrolase (beta-lactamase superfamily II)
VARLLKSVALAVFVLIIAVVGIIAFTFLARMGPVDGREVSGARVIVDGFASIGVVPLRDGQVALVDAGNDEEGVAIFRELERRSLDADSVAAIFLTHGHPDHIGAVGQFPNAEIMALAEEVPLIEGRAGARGPLPRFFPVNPTGIVVTRHLRDGEVVTLSGVAFRVYAVPGHTAGSAAYLANGVLYVGDSADTANDGTLIGAPWIFSDSQAENRASLVRLEQRLAADGAEVRAIVPAHSALQQGSDQLSEFAAAHR